MIRRANAEDVENVKELLKQVLKVHADGRPDIFIADTTKYTNEELIEIFNDDSRPVFVYVDKNGKAVGHAFCLIEEIKNCNNMHDMKSIYIDDICVDQNHRHQGIATSLYNHVIDYAKKLECYHVTLNVWEINPGAKQFYQSMGMKPLKTTMELII